jgi:hypothetical protein
MIAESHKTMFRDLNLRVSDSLFLHLEKQAKDQGVSLETLCVLLLSGENKEDSLIDPAFYPSLTLGVLRTEVRKVIESNLPKDEVRKRITGIELQISRRYIR